MEFLKLHFCFSGGRGGDGEEVPKGARGLRSPLLCLKSLLMSVWAENF